MYYDNDIPDWEIQDEEPHENLKKKWEQDECAEKCMITCPECGKRITSDAFNCIYCGTTVFTNSGFIGKVTSFVMGWGGGIVFFAVLLMIVVFLIL